MRLLLICGALAAGEYLASFVPQAAGAWPVAAIVATLFGLFGYGWGTRWICYAAVTLFGIALFLFASQDQEQTYRMSPWMRGKEWRTAHRQEKREGLANEMKDDLSRRVGIGLADFFDKIFISSTMKLMKPGQEIFLEAIRQTGLKADELLFIDDSPRNTQAARIAGIPSIDYVQGSDLAAAIEPALMH